MRIIKPNWVEHTGGEKKAKTPIYSISVHPDGTRLATGGQDNKVKIWSTLPILDEEAAQDDANHKLLCTMSAHTGPVLTARWAHHGRYLATGSDDAVLLIWDIDPAGGGRVFGSEEVNVENWKALRRLVGHAADVVDCAWSRDDSMLASVGLDSKVIIWDGYTFERIVTLDAHGGFVKGVTWDPVGNFLATQSDDKTVKIWDTDTWQCIETVSKPFEMSPQSTFFRRLSWSPDGAFIAASNAMNGPVFVAAVIERVAWESDISFVGHENTIQVAAFNPRLFFGKDVDPSRLTASCMVALGADDYTISIWRNTLHKPLAIIRDIFSRQILDLCWSNDGLCLYGCSADGTIIAIKFKPAEFPELSVPEQTQKVLDEYAYVPKRRRAAPKLISTSTSFSAAPSSATEHVNIIVPRKGKPKERRRINLSGTMTGGSQANGSSAGGGAGSSGGRPPLQRPTTPQPTRRGAADAFAAAADDNISFGSPSAATASMLRNARIAFDHDAENARAGDKRRASVDGEWGRTPKGRNMGSSRTLAPVQEIRAPRVVVASGGSQGSSISLPLPSIQSALRVQQEDGTAVFTAENGGDDSPHHSVTFAQGGKDLWLDFLPSAILAIVATSKFCAAACEDGSVRVYTLSGRHLTSLRLPAPVSEFEATKNKLMILTADGMVRVLDTTRNCTLYPASPISHLLNLPSTSANPIPPATISSAHVFPNGCAVVVTSEPAAWAYDPDLAEWTQIASGWWSTSPLNEIRTRAGRSTSTGPLADIEQRVANAATTSVPSDKPKWWDEALSVGHYETRLRASRLLGSKEEYRACLREYGKFLGEENFRERAEELVKELTGPRHYNSKIKWDAELLGVQKRELAKDLLHAMKTTVALGQFAGDQLAAIKDAIAEEAELLE